jgi:CRISPR-associated protein Cmr3
MQKMSATNYIIRLKPLTPFFFGGENTFGEGDNVNYHVRSNYLPQQSALLGLLRYQLLAQNKLIGTNPVDENWNALIGENSFIAATEDTTAQTFGAIKNLSPLFLSNGTDHYLPQALDWTIAKPEKDASEQLLPIWLSFTANGVTDTGSRRSNIPVLMSGYEHFNPKNGTKSLWVKSDGTNMRQWDWEDEVQFDSSKGFGNGFFIEQQQVGIYRRVKKSTSDTGDFYKQAFYRLADDFAFAFYAQLDIPAGKTLGNATVQLGGERSLFLMTVEPAANTFSSLFTPNTFTKGHQRTQKAIVLVSDALAAADIMQKCDFAITETVPFRNILTKTVQKGDYTRIRGGAIGKPDNLLYLIKRGSIFFAADTTALKLALQNNNCYNTGYNHFIEL